MSTNGNTNGHANGAPEVMPWKVGLINSAQKYLTAEKFGHKINASGQGLKKNQTWTIELDTKEDVVYIKSHLNCYISADKYGKVTCEKEASDLESCDKFVVDYAKDGSGRWSFKNLEHGNYFGGTEDNVQCFSKNITDNQLWTVQLAIHPQINLRNVNRKRYAAMCDDELQCKTTVPWTEAGLIILHYSEGKYALKTCDNRFLHRDGRLVNDLENDAKFTLEIRAGATSSCGLAFKDSYGFYLTAVGSTATMKSGKNKVAGKDELFTVEDSHPQVTISSVNTGKLISVKQGVDLSANQTEVDDHSIFQMEFDKPSGKWSFRTSEDNKYWSLESFGGIQATCMTICPKALFTVESDGDGKVCIRAQNGKCLYNKQTGSILANADVPESKEFIIKVVNRPYIILKCDFGFVGLKSSTASKPEIVCNKTSYGVTFLEAAEDGYYYLKADNLKYWTVGESNTILADSDNKSNANKFLLEFQGQSLMSIRAPNGKYLKGEPNNFSAKGDEVDSLTTWEY